VNILFLTPQLPHPPRQGTAIRNWGLIKSLSARHRISLLTFASVDEVITPELRTACQLIDTVSPPQRTRWVRLAQLITSPLPDLAHRLYSEEYALRLKNLLTANTYDAIFVEGLELANYLLASSQVAITIFDAHNCETVLQRRAYETDIRNPRRWLAALYSSIQARRLARFEAAVCQWANYVTCVSNEDAAALKTLAPDVEPVVVPNGIFLSDYGFSPAPSSPAPQLVFTGKMDYRPNVDAVTWFADEILPHIQKTKPGTQFVIVGQKPVAAVQQLAGRDGITVAGAVEDIRPYIINATVYVAPLRMGGGTRFKLLEAMALKTPIVSTRVGAEGFAVQDGQELRLADAPEAFAGAVLRLLDDTTRREALASAAYTFVKRYDWGEIVPAVEALLTRRTRD
jgi:sugar transferase (PEP-CTERM/EpsH1 system associated)